MGNPAPPRNPNGLLLRLLREAAGIPRDAMAERLGYTYSHLANFENGRRDPKARTLRAYEAALGLREMRVAQLTEAPFWLEDGSALAPTQGAVDAYMGALDDLVKAGIVISPATALSDLEAARNEWLHRSEKPRTQRRREVTGSDMALAAAVQGPSAERLEAITSLSRVVEQLSQHEIELLIAFGKGLLRDSGTSPTANS